MRPSWHGIELQFLILQAKPLEQKSVFLGCIFLVYSGFSVVRHNKITLTTYACINNNYAEYVF